MITQYIFVILFAVQNGDATANHLRSAVKPAVRQIVSPVVRLISELYCLHAVYCLIFNGFRWVWLEDITLLSNVIQIGLMSILAWLMELFARVTYLYFFLPFSFLSFPFLFDVFFSFGRIVLFRSIRFSQLREYSAISNCFYLFFFIIVSYSWLLIFKFFCCTYTYSFWRLHREFCTHNSMNFAVQKENWRKRLVPVHGTGKQTHYPSYRGQLNSIEQSSPRNEKLSDFPVKKKILKLHLTKTLNLKIQTNKHMKTAHIHSGQS